MEIKKEIIGELNELITVELSPEDYQAQVEKSLKDLRQKLNVPGFRKGMVPMGMIKKMHGKSVLVDEVFNIANDVFNNYLKENYDRILFEPIACPDKTIADFEKEENFSFSFEIGLQPEINVNYDEGKKVVNYKITATNEEIDTEIMSLRKRVGKFSSTETVAEEDMLLVSVTPSEGEDYTSSIILNYLKDKELKNFIGKKLHDEMDIDTTKIFKSDYERSTFLKVKIEALETAPKNVHIKIDAIHHTEPAEIDADFFMKIFPDKNVTNEAELQEHIKKHIELRYVTDANILYQNKVLEILIENTSFSLPDAFIKKYLVETSEEYTSDNIEEKYVEIQKSIKAQLLHNKVIDDCGIYVDKDEILNYTKSFIRQHHFGTTEILEDEQEEQIEKFAADMMKDKKNVRNAQENILLEKLTHGLKEKLNPKTKKLSYKSFIEEISGKKEKSSSPAKKEGKTKEIETETEIS